MYDQPAPTEPDSLCAFLFQPAPGQGLDPPVVANQTHFPAPDHVFAPTASIFSPFSQLPNPFAMPQATEAPSTVQADTEEVIRTAPPRIEDAQVMSEGLHQALDTLSRLTPAQRQFFLTAFAKKWKKSKSGEGVADNGSESRQPTPIEDQESFLDAMNRLSKTGQPGLLENTLQLKQTNFCAAILENGVAIGMAQSKLLLDDGTIVRRLLPSNHSCVPLANHE